MQARALARIEMARLQRREQRLGIEALRLDLDEAAESVALAVVEMRVVGGDRASAAGRGWQPVEQVEAVAAVGLDRAAVIVDLDRVRGLERAAVVFGELRPGGMGDGDEGAGLAGAAREFAARSRRLVGAAKSSGRPTARMCHSSPTLGRHRVQLGADQRGEIIGAGGARVGDRPAEAVEEMLGELEEVVAVALVGGDHRFRREAAVGERRMRVQIAAPETSGGREGAIESMGAGASWVSGGAARSLAAAT